MSPSDVQTPRGARGPGLVPGPTRPRLGSICLFTGLTGLTSMLLLAGWTDTRPPSGAGDPFATVVFAALLSVAALFAVAWLWPVRAPSPRRRIDRE